MSRISLASEWYRNDKQQLVFYTICSRWKMCVHHNFQRECTDLIVVGGVDDGLIMPLWSPDCKLLVLVTGITSSGVVFTPWKLFKDLTISPSNQSYKVSV